MPHRDWLTRPAGGVPSVRRRSTMRRWPPGRRFRQCESDTESDTYSVTIEILEDELQALVYDILHPSRKGAGKRGLETASAMSRLTRHVSVSHIGQATKRPRLDGLGLNGITEARNLQTMSVQFPAPALCHFSSKNQFSIVCLGHCLCSSQLTWLSDWNTKMALIAISYCSTSLVLVPVTWVLE